MPLSRARRALVAGGLFFLIVSVFSLVFMTLATVHQHLDAAVAAIGLGVFGLMPMALGTGLVLMGDHTLPGRSLASARAGTARTLGTLVSAARWRNLVRSSFGRALLCAMAIALVALVTRNGGAAGFTAFLALTAYSAVDPIAFAIARHRGTWLRQALTSIAAWVALFIACMPAASGLGEGSMVFLFDFSLYPAALVVSGVVRLFLNTQAKPASSGEP